jgi:hypothetical protein
MKKRTARESRIVAKRAVKAFKEAYLGFRNSSEGVGDGGEDLGPMKSDYGVSPSDVTAERDKKSWADGSEAEGGEGYHMDEAVKRAGFRLTFKNKSGGRTYENEAGHRIFVSKSGEAYSKSAEGKKFYANESEIQAAYGKRESVRTFFRRYLRG